MQNSEGKQENLICTNYLFKWVLVISFIISPINPFVPRMAKLNKPPGLNWMDDDIGLLIFFTKPLSGLVIRFSSKHNFK